MTLYWLQIVDKDGVVAKLPGGGSLERDLIAEVTQRIVKAQVPMDVEATVARIVAKGVGFLKTEAQVAAAIRSGLAEQSDRGLVSEAVEAAVTAVVRDLKNDTRYVVR